MSYALGETRARILVCAQPPQWRAGSGHQGTRTNLREPPQVLDHPWDVIRRNPAGDLASAWPRRVLRVPLKSTGAYSWFLSTVRPS